MSATMNDSAINKAVLTMTKLEGHEDWPLWSAMIHVAMGGPGPMLVVTKFLHLVMPRIQDTLHGALRTAMLTKEYSLP